MIGGIPERLERRLDPASRYGLRLTLFGIALALVAIPFGFFLDQVLRRGVFIEVDTWAANHLHEMVRDSPMAVHALQVVSFLGKPIWFVVMCVPIGVFLLRRGHFHLAVFLAATTIGGGAVDTWVKAAVNRDRPSLEDPVATAFGHSFPSGHAMQAVVVYGSLLLIFLPIVPTTRRRLAIGATAVLALAIGLSRLALGVHFISDVLGAYALGLAWLAAATAAFEIWREDRGLRTTKPATEGIEPEAEADLHLTA